MRISDWSSDVCSSDLPLVSDDAAVPPGTPRRLDGGVSTSPRGPARSACVALTQPLDWKTFRRREKRVLRRDQRQIRRRSEEHTSELQSLMRISYAVFCLKKKKKTITKMTCRYIRENDTCV